MGVRLYSATDPYRFVLRGPRSASDPRGSPALRRRLRSSQPWRLRHRQVVNARLARLPERVRVEVLASILRLLRALDPEWVLLGPGVLPNAGDDPVDLLPRCTARDREPPILDLARNVKVWRGTADGRELDVVIPVECLVVSGQADGDAPAAVEHCAAPVHVEPLRCFHEAVLEGFVGGILGMVDQERATGL